MDAADAGQVINIQLVEERVQTLCLQLLHGSLAPCLVPGREHHIPGELLAQAMRDRKADALVSASYQSYVVARCHS